MTENKDVFKKIYENYDSLNKKMVDEMKLSSIHGSLTGSQREEMWMNFFRSIIPKKFSISQGVLIIDSFGNVSSEVDIAVYDEQYTPYVFQYNSLKFIPIEAVAVVIECKSLSFEKDKLDTWASNITKLKTEQCGIARTITKYANGAGVVTQTRTTPIKILACLRNNMKDETVNKIKDTFDFIIEERTEEECKFELVIPNEDKSLEWWGDRLNNHRDNYEQDQNLDHVCCVCKGGFCTKSPLNKLKVCGNPFLSLNMQLNQLLMLINNPMLFPHYAYAKKFNEIALSMEKEKGEI